MPRVTHAPQTFYRWKKQFNGLRLQELRGLRSLRSRRSLLKGGHSRRLQWPEAPALIFLRALHP